MSEEPSSPESRWALEPVTTKRRRRGQPRILEVDEKTTLVVETVTSDKLPQQRRFAATSDALNDEREIRPTVVRAYDYANRDEAAAAAREGRSPTRPPYRWSEESRAPKRKPRDA